MHDGSRSSRDAAVPGRTPAYPNTPATNTPHTNTPATNTPHTNTPHTNTPATNTPHTNTPHTNSPLSDTDLATLLALHERASAHGITARNRDAAIDALATLQSCADHLEVTLTYTIARVEAARRSQTGRTTSAVISGFRKIPAKHADWVVKTAVRHATYPDVLTARATGRISAPNAITVIRAVDDVAPFFTDDQRAEALRTLLDDAATSMPDAFRARCRSYLDTVDRQGSRTRAEQDALTKKLSHNKRFLSFRGNRVDGFTIRGHLPGTYAEVVRSWIARESTRLARAARAKGAPVPGEATRDLDALVSLAQKAASASHSSPRGAPASPLQGSGPSSPQRNPAAPGNGPSSPQRNPAAPGNGPRSRRRDPTYPCRLGFGDPIASSRHSAPASRHPADGPSSHNPSQPGTPDRASAPTLPGRGNPTPSKQPHPIRGQPSSSAAVEDPRARHIGLELRAHLAKRDGGCVAPYCTAPPERCDGHHIIKYSAGGPTTANNVCLVCARHHPQFENPPGSPDGWTFRLIGGLPHAIPPTNVDPDQRPLLHDRLRPKIPLPKGFRPPPTPPCPPQG